MAPDDVIGPYVADAVVVDENKAKISCHRGRVVQRLPHPHVVGHSLEPFDPVRVHPPQKTNQQDDTQSNQSRGQLEWLEIHLIQLIKAGSKKQGCEARHAAGGRIMSEGCPRRAANQQFSFGGYLLFGRPLGVHALGCGFGGDQAVLAGQKKMGEWKRVENGGKQWKTVENSGKQWKTVENSGKRSSCFFKSVNLLQLLGNN